jgi:hypothetical protein
MKIISAVATLIVMGIGSLVGQINSCNGFMQGSSFTKTTSSPKQQIIANDAIQLFNASYPFNRAPLQTSSLVGFGMPITDLDGTILQKTKGTAGKRLTDITPMQARATFNELAKLYGSNEAYDMVKALPIILSFNKKQFAPSLQAMSIALGDPDRAKAIVQLNPGLLAITPINAATVSEQTVVFSYLVGYTRPFGPILLPALLLALFSPAIEVTTGIPIQSSFLALFSSLQ